MNAQYEIIFQKALVSKNPKAILGVSRVFEEIGESRKARLLCERVRRWNCTDIIVFGVEGESRSVSDLIDITAAKDVDMSNLTQRFLEVLNGPNASMLSSTGLTDAYKALVDRYNDARAIAQKTIDAFHLLPNAVASATTEYEHLLDVLNSHWRENTWTPGDWSFEDVNARITALGATGKHDVPTPQPKAATLLGVFNAATTAMEGAAKGAGTLTGQATAGLTGQLNWQTILKIAALVGVALILLPKILSMTPARALVR